MSGPGRTLAVLLLLGLVAGGDAAGEDPGVEADPAPVARAFVDSVRAGRPALSAEGARGADLVAVLSCLLTEELGGPDPAGILRAFAQEAERRSPAAAALARRWAQAGAQALAEERRWLRLLASLPRHAGSEGASPWTEVLSQTEGLPSPPGASLALAALLERRASALVAVTRGREAEPLLGALLEQAGRLGWERLEARALQLRQSALRQQGRQREATVDALRLADLYVRLGREAEASGMLQTALILLGQSGAPRLGREVLLKILALDPAALDDATRLQLEVWLAGAEAELGHSELARALLERALPAAQATGNAPAVRTARTLLLRIAVDQGRMGDALGLADAVLAEAPTHDPFARAPWLSVAGSYLRLGLPERALALALTLREAFTQQGRQGLALVAEADRHAAAALLALKRQPEAGTRLEAACGVLRSLDRAPRLGSALMDLAHLHLSEGRTAQARLCWEEVRALGERATTVRPADLLECEARLLLAEGDPATALARTSAALSLRDDPRVLADAAIARTHAQALLALGSPADAVAVLLGTAEALRPLTAGLAEVEAAGLRAFAQTLSQQALRALRDLLTRAPDRVPDLLPQVFRLREIGQALLLAGAVARDATAPPPVDPALLRTQAEAVEDLTREQASLVLQQTRPTSSVEALSEARGRVAAAHERVASLAGRVRRAAPGAPPAPDPVELRALQALLPPEAALVSLGLDGASALALVVRTESAVAVDLGPQAGLAERAEAWLELVSTPGGPAEGLGRDLFRRLVAPLLPHLAGVKRLVVVAEGALAQLPLEALIDADGAPLLERFDVAYAPSASTLVALQSRARGRAPGRGLLALADPSLPGPGVAGLPPLAGTRAEVEAVAALYPEAERTLLLGAQATLAALERELARAGGTPWRAVHLACHGWVDPERPRLGGLVLAGGEVWNVERAGERAVPADLVVLSACESTGTSVAAGEGLVGLVRPLLSGGATQVLASAWRVPDASTASLLADVQRRWTTGGVPLATALAAAKRAQRARGGAQAHPYAWAPFVLWGDAGR